MAMYAQRLSSTAVQRSQNEFKLSTLHVNIICEDNSVCTEGVDGVLKAFCWWIIHDRIAPMASSPGVIGGRTGLERLGKAR